MKTATDLSLRDAGGTFDRIRDGILVEACSSPAAIRTFVREYVKVYIKETWYGTASWQHVYKVWCQGSEFEHLCDFVTQYVEEKQNAE